MRKLMMFLVCSVTLTGCSISVNEDGHEWDDWGDEWDDERTREERAADVCDPYCIDLIECGALSDSAFVSCRDLCMDRFEEDERAVTEGCACVQAAQCQADVARTCDGDPLPDVLSGPGSSGDGDSAPTAGAGGTLGGGDYSTEACSSNHDCALGEDCIEGACAARCVASCQCDEGQACSDGYCAAPEEPVVECSTDCDCTSGMRCVEGACE